VMLQYLDIAMVVVLQYLVGSDRLIYIIANKRYGVRIRKNKLINNIKRI
jgi:hypothetical protein